MKTIAAPRGLAKSIVPARGGFFGIPDGVWPEPAVAEHFDRLVARAERCPLQRSGDIEGPLLSTRLERQAYHGVDNTLRLERAITGELRPPGALPMPGDWAYGCRAPNWRGPRFAVGRYIIRRDPRCVKRAAELDAE